MPDLHDLLATQAARHEPVVVPPFDELVRRAVRRRQRRVVTAVLATAAVVGGVVLLVRQQPPREVLVADPPAPAQVVTRTCLPRDLMLSLDWVRQPSGELKGTLTAMNPTAEGCLLLVKPDVDPEAPDASSLGLSFATTKELLLGPDTLLPGQAARAPVDWYSLCGAKAGRTASVTWSDLPAARITTTGALQPHCASDDGPGNQLSSSWFTGLSEHEPVSPVTVRGTLVMVGGIDDAKDDPVAGQVTFEPTAPQNQRVTVDVGQDGTFTATVQPGTYRVTGTSPQYQGGNVPCTADGLVDVPASGALQVQVVCPRK